MRAPLLDRIPVRLPGAAPAVIVVASEPSSPLRGYGEAPLVAGRPGEAALASAEESARLDLDARRAGVRLVDLLGGAVRNEVECTQLVRSARPPALAEEVREAVDRGFRAFKLKTLDGGATLDQERLGAARWAAGQRAGLRIDFNGRLELGQAEARLRSLGAFGLELVEQPLPAGDTPASWRALAAETGAVLAADESLAGAGAAALVEAGVVPAVKVATVGGARAALALIARAPRATFGSSMETSIGVAFALHAACAYPGELLACGLATFAGGPDLASGLRVEAGRLRLPDGPGLGIAVDPALLERYRA